MTDFTHDENLHDSGMTAEQRGEPITHGECVGAAKTVKDAYSALLLSFLTRRVERLKKELEHMREWRNNCVNTIVALEKENRDLRATLDQACEFGGNPIV